VRFDYEEGELDDGADNNGNGLVDEGCLFWTRDVGEPSEKTHVIARGVREYLEGEEPNLDDDNGNGLEDERGFCLERVGEALVIRLTLERQVSGEGLPDEDHRNLGQAEELVHAKADAVPGGRGAARLGDGLHGP
jgi:hypothetical protein